MIDFAGLPFMSVIICAYNSEHTISRAIESLLAQNYPDDRFEIIVIDDGSIDRTSEIVQQYPVHYIRHHINLGLAAARNSGLANMKGDIYVSFDDDCVVSSGWLLQLSTGYQEINVAGVGSLLQEPPELHGMANRFMAANGSGNPASLRLDSSRNPLYRFFAYLVDQFSTDSQRHLPIFQARELNGATSTFPAEILLSVGGWDETLRAAEDTDLCSRIREVHPELRFIVVSSAQVIHDPNMSLRKFLLRPYRRGSDTLKYYRRNSVMPPVFPLPFAWITGIITAGLLNSSFIPVVAAALPHILYAWWPFRAVQEREPRHLLHTYIQLAEEAATIAGLIRARTLLRRDAIATRTPSAAAPPGQRTIFPARQPAPRSPGRSHSFSSRSSAVSRASSRFATSAAASTVRGPRRRRHPHHTNSEYLRSCVYL